MGIFKINTTGFYRRQDAIEVFVSQGAAERQCRILNAQKREYMVIWMWGLTA